MTITPASLSRLAKPLEAIRVHIFEFEYTKYSDRNLKLANLAEGLRVSMLRLLVKAAAEATKTILLGADFFNKPMIPEKGFCKDVCRQKNTQTDNYEKYYKQPGHSSLIRNLSPSTKN